jgi:hypothetical protein
MSNANFVEADVVPPKRSGKALASMILGLSSFVCSLFAGIPAVILGILGLIEVNNSQGRIHGQGLAITGIVTGGIGSFLCLPMLVGLLVPAVQNARETGRRAVSMNNLRQINAAIQNYYITHESYPTNISDASGKPLLSWRVAILPYLEQKSLYDEFHLDEPWDSAHNKALVARMPAIFDSVSGNRLEGETNYLLPVGPGNIYEPGKKPKGDAAIARGDGLSNTIMLVEADDDRAVPWTKPQDLTYDPADPMAGLGHLRPGGFVALFADGHIKFIRGTATPATLKSLFSANGGEMISDESF